MVGLIGVWNATVVPWIFCTCAEEVYPVAILQSDYCVTNSVHIFARPCRVVEIEIVSFSSCLVQPVTTHCCHWNTTRLREAFTAVLPFVAVCSPLGSGRVGTVTLAVCLVSPSPDGETVRAFRVATGHVHLLPCRHHSVLQPVLTLWHVETLSCCCDLPTYACLRFLF